MARDAALETKLTKSRRASFDAGEIAFEALRAGRIRPGTTAQKHANDALRKFAQALG